MLNSDKILTLHPDGKAGVNISRLKYEQVKKAVELVIKESPNITFSAMAEKAKGLLIREGFEGKPLWYITTVKLDLEARGRVKRVPKTSPHQLVMGESNQDF